MKNILIPTDFSDASRDAFLYAQSFVQDSASFKVMHSYHPQMELAYPYLEALPESVSEKREGELYNFVKAFHPSAEGNVMIKNAVSSVLKIGLATDTIIKESEGDTDLIIMGRTGSNSVFEKVFGTVSTHVAQNAFCPILLVPQNTHFKGLKKVLYATNRPILKEASNIHQLLSIVEAYQPEIHFVQVKNDIFNYYDIDNEEKNLAEFFQQTAPDCKFNVSRIQSDNALESLHTYAEEHSIDMIAIDTNHRSTIEQIFHRSMTKRMVLNSQIPLLILHDI